MNHESAAEAPMSVSIADPHPSRDRDPVRSVIRAFNPLARPLAGRRFFHLWGIVHHQGRKTGRAYATPVVVRADATSFTIPLPFGVRTAWANNVIAAGGARIRWAGVDHDVTNPEIVSGTEAELAFDRFQRFALRRFGIDHFLRVRRNDRD
jgi:deazaflavin-dependent oxidoreductase (nitroreductase family)